MMNIDLPDDVGPFYFFKLFISGCNHQFLSRSNESICTEKDRSSQLKGVKTTYL